MKSICLHIIQSFSSSCLNRDQLGRPKEIDIGGATRSRISSQCYKHYIRKLCRQLSPERFKSIRTKFLKTRIERALADRKVDLETVQQNVNEVLETFNSHKEKSLIFISEGELSTMVDAIINHDRKDSSGKKTSEKKSSRSKKKSSWVKNAMKDVRISDAADIAFFGRMMAVEKSFNVESASSFSDSVSVHSVENEIDFFTGVGDDENEKGGADYVDNLECNAATYYRYVHLDLDILKKNLPDLTAEERREIVAVFIEAVLTSVPGGHQKGKATSQRPFYVMGIYSSKGQPITYDGAFEKPILSSDGYNEKAKELLKKHHENKVNTWCHSIDELREIPGDNLVTFCEELTKHVE